MLRISNSIQILIAVIIFIAIIIKAQIYDSVVLNSDPRFTVARIYRIESVSNGGPIARFSYSIKNNIYKGFFDIDADKKSTTKIGDTYILKFKNGDPNNAEIECQCLVPDSILNNLQSEGWKTRPKEFCINQ